MDYPYKKSSPPDGLLTASQRKTKNNFKKEIWVTTDGTEIPLSELSYDHIQNIIMVLRNNPMSDINDYGRRWIRKLKKEIKRRQECLK